MEKILNCSGKTNKINGLTEMHQRGQGFEFILLPVQLSTEVAYLLLTQQPWVWFPAFPKKILRKKLSMLLKFINVAGWRKVDCGMKMLMEPI